MINLDFFKKPAEIKEYRPPETMSFSKRKIYRKCPRQYYYSEIDYIDGITFHILKGIIFHKSIEKIIEFSEENGCETIKEYSIALIGKGYKSTSDLINEEKKSLMENYASNPRFSRQKKLLKSKIEDYIPTLQKEINKHCSELYNSSYFVKKNKIKKENKKKGRNFQFTSFDKGTYSEVWFKSDILGDYGQIDQLKIDEHGIDIIDLKTGKEREEDQQQLYFYQILVTDDKRTSDQRVKNLYIKYEKQKKRIDPLTKDEVNALRKEYINQKKRVLLLTEKNHFKTIVGDECKSCFYRQLCNDYWGSITDKDIQQTLIDLEVEVSEDNNSFKNLKIKSGTKDKTELKLTFKNNNDPFKNMMIENCQFRILNGVFREDEEGKRSVYIDERSEIYTKEHYS
jgi:hypothetical protein